MYSTNELTSAASLSTLEAAIKLARAAGKYMREKIKLAEVKPERARVLWKPRLNPADIPIDEKYRIISDMDNAIHKFDEIVSVESVYADGTTALRFLSTEGADIYSEVTRTMIQANIVARRGTNITSYRMRLGATLGYETFNTYDPIEEAIKSAEATIRILHAAQPPSGKMAVIADPDLTGVFIHEALGHAIEADLVVAGDSILEGKIGKPVGAEIVTVIDDPTIRGAFGSFPYDDEGLRARKKVLIDHGVLLGYLLNRETAYKLNMDPNGAARAESYATRPIVRMSNTLLERGDWDFDELFEDIKYGVYAKGTRGGQVDTAKGSFQFSAQEAFLIERGEITTPLKDFSLSGMTLKTLKSIDAISNLREFGTPGFCGKGQLVPVGDGGPHIRIQDVFAGGRK
jgi:TldD protein